MDISLKDILNKPVPEVPNSPKFKAVKALREHFNLSLKQALDLTEALDKEVGLK